MGLTLSMQQTVLQISGRGARGPLGLDVMTPEAERPGKLLQFVAGGSGRRAVAVTGGGADPTLRTDLQLPTAGALVAYRQTGSLTIQTVQDKLDQVVSVIDHGAKCDASVASDGTVSGTDDTAAIQKAIDKVAAAGGGEVVFPRGKVRIDGTLILKSGVTLRGVNRRSTVLIKSGGGHIMHFLGSDILFDVHIDRLGFNCADIDAAVWVQNAQGLRVTDCAFDRMKYWAIVIGCVDGSRTDIINIGATVSGCRFGYSSMTYEHVLLLNAQDVLLDNNRHESRGIGSSIGVGIYQQCERITVSNSYFAMHIGLYYSISTNNITLINCHFDGCDTPIQGANVSDNGTFGYQRVYGLTCSKLQVRGCTGPMQIGGVTHYDIDGLFDLNKSQAIVVNRGNPAIDWAGALSQEGRIRGTFRGNNADAGLLTNNPAILIAGIGGDLHLKIDADFLDEKANPTQGYPIVFDGAPPSGSTALQFAYVTVTGRLTPYNGAISVGASNGATFGRGCQIFDASDFVGPVATAWRVRPTLQPHVKPTGDRWYGAFNTANATLDTTRQTLAAVLDALMTAGIIEEQK